MCDMTQAVSVGAPPKRQLLPPGDICSCGKIVKGVLEFQTIGESTHRFTFVRIAFRLPLFL